MIKHQRQHICDVEGHAITKADSFTGICSDLICIIISVSEDFYHIPQHNRHSAHRYSLISENLLETPQIFIYF